MGVVETLGPMSSEELAAFGLIEDDPRQSLLLRSVQTCLGQSGLGRQELRGQSIGFFCGLSGNEMYHELMMTGDVKSLSRAAQGLLSNAGYVNRIAWFYGTKGPSICIDTEESSSAAAMDTALNYEREDRCNKAVVCSTQLIQHPVSLILCCAMGQLSTSGRGRAFDESSDGVVRSEGLPNSDGSMNHLQSYQMQMLLRPGDVAIDVGANLGCYTVALAEVRASNRSPVITSDHHNFEKLRFHLLDVDSVARDQDVAFLEALATVGYQCARADSAPGDVICTDAGEVVKDTKSHECLIGLAKLRSKRLRRSHDLAEPSSPRCAVHVVTKHLVMEKYDGRDSRWRVGHSEEALQNSCCQRMRTPLKNTAIVFNAFEKYLQACAFHVSNSLKAIHLRQPEDQCNWQSPTSWTSRQKRGSVALFLEAVRQKKVEEVGFDFAEDNWEDELEDDDLTKARMIVAGSALNSRGQSSSLTTPSGPAMQDLIHSALKDAKSPACIIDAIEVSAGGSLLMDAIELGVLRKTLQSGERSKVLCSFKSVIGESGPPSGLAALVRACLTVEKGARSKGKRVYHRVFGPSHQQWKWVKDMLNVLILNQRLETSLARAKELQQYAEEIVFLAKKNTVYHDGLVESMLTSPEARQILYERMLPRYKDRHFHFSRVVNLWKYRQRDTTPLAVLEYVDRPGELRPANPVGAARKQHVAMEFLSTRRSRRKHVSEVQRMLDGTREPPLDAAVVERLRFECTKYHGAVHSPQLHLRQMCSFASGEVDEEDVIASPLLATEVMPSASAQQTLGISSFGNSGTNVQLILMGSSPQFKEEWQTGKELHWFPASIPENKETSYYIIGSFNSWGESVKMKVESQGVYYFNMVLGENRWETFQIWEDGNPDKVLHPGSHWADQDVQVHGPSRQGVCGRYSTWRLSGKPTKVRLLNEDEARDLDMGPCAEEMLSYSGDIEFLVLTAFPGDYKPDGDECPVVDEDDQLLGMPGDCYRVWLRLGGKYRRVEWRKLSSPVPQALQASSYYIAGDFNFWEFQQMQEEEPSSSSKSRSFFTEVKLRSSEDVFQVVRNKDWDQAFYPEAETQKLRGPDGYGVAKGWRLPGKAGDVFRIHFQRSLPSSGADEKSVSWSLQPKASQELALPKSYCIVGSWSNFVSKDAMRFDEAKSAWLAEVEVGKSGMEFFQFLLHGCWLAAVYPNSHEADFRKSGHAVLGPDSRGGRSYWRLEDGLQAGDRVEVVLEVDTLAMPKAVRWQKAS
eukprot:symbB.v1.2.008073.t2/scaffold504.1/size194584/9